MAVVWLNGAFGVGKTSVAGELRQLVPGARLVDPERIGFVVQRTFWRGVDYQDVELWRRLTAWRVSSAGRRTTVIVPMTVTDPVVFEQVTAGARVFVLTADRTTLEQRITESGEAVEWRLAQIDRCLDAFRGSERGTPVSTEGRAPSEVAKEIAAAL